MSAQYSTLNMNGKTVFRNNSAKYCGGGIHAAQSTLYFTGNSVFCDNIAGIYGEGISNVHPGYYGGGIYAWNSTLSLAGIVTFKRNSAEIGGGFYAGYSTVDLTGNSTFRSNSARTSGGGFYAKGSFLKIATHNIVKYSKYSCSTDTSLFISNLALIHGGAIHTIDSTLSFERCNIFSGNSAGYYGGGIHSHNSTLNFSGDTSFSSNSAGLQGGGINGLGSSIYFSGNTTFRENTAARGGGEYLANTFNFFSRYANLTMDSNEVTEYGGAVYVQDSEPVSYCFDVDILNLGRCFLQVAGSYNIAWNYTGYEIQAYLDIHLQFYTNYAQIAGSAVYGGALKGCIMEMHHEMGGVSTTNGSLLYLKLEVDSVSSDPYKVLLCEAGIPNFNTSNSELIRQVYPGELLHFPVVAAGQGEETTPAVIRAFFNDTNGIVSLAQFQDRIKGACTLERV